MDAHHPAPLHTCHPRSSPTCPKTSGKSQHLPLGSFLADSVSSTRNMIDFSPMSSDSAFCLEDVLMEFRSCTVLLLDWTPEQDRVQHISRTKCWSELNYIWLVPPNLLHQLSLFPCKKCSAQCPQKPRKNVCPQTVQLVVQTISGSAVFKILKPCKPAQHSTASSTRHKSFHMQNANPKAQVPGENWKYTSFANFSKCLQKTFKLQYEVAGVQLDWLPPLQYLHFC